MRVAISQSNYIPWLGYFHLMSCVDVFILLDNVQFTRRDWRNRNRILGPNGVYWLTVPVVSKGNFHQSIEKVRLADEDWQDKHWKSIELSYSKAPFFREVAGALKPEYENGNNEYLVNVNHALIRTVTKYIGIETALIGASEFAHQSDSNERLLSICEELGASTYVSAPAAKGYISEEKFRDRGVSLEWFEYPTYSPYKQAWGAEFVDRLSIVDVLMNNSKSWVREEIGLSPA